MASTLLQKFLYLIKLGHHLALLWVKIKSDNDELLYSGDTLFVAKPEIPTSKGSPICKIRNIVTNLVGGDILNWAEIKCDYKWFLCPACLPQWKKKKKPLWDIGVKTFVSSVLLSRRGSRNVNQAKYKQGYFRYINSIINGIVVFTFFIFRNIILKVHWSIRYNEIEPII